MSTRREFLAQSAGAGIALSPIAMGSLQPNADRATTVLVLGGTGFLGPHEIDQAEDREWEITIFNRGRTKERMFADDFKKVERLKGDRDPDKGSGLTALREAIDGGRTWDVVIDNSGYFPRHARASAELLKDATDQYIFISTVSVYADNETRGQDESAAVGTIDDPTSEEFGGATYGPLKALCEQEVRKIYGSRATIIRPGLIVGPGDPTDRFTYWPVRCDQGGEVVIPVGDPRSQFIDVRDLANFIMLCIEQGHGGTYNALGPRGPLYFREMVDGCKAVTSSPVTFVEIPMPFMERHGVGMFAGPNSIASWTPADGEYAGFNTFDNSKAIADGMTFRTLADTASTTLAWFKSSARANEPLGRAAGLSPEKEAEVLSAWKKRDSNPDQG